MNFLKTEGIIINKLSLRDADKLLTIFTRDYGKIVCYAKGVRNITSSRITKIGLFSRIKFEVIEKYDRKTLTHVDLKDSYRHSKKDLSNISRLFQIGELINALLPENQSNETIYDLLEKALGSLHKFDTPEYLRRFKVRMLKELGYGSHDKDENSIDAYIEFILEKPLKAKNIL